MARLPQKRTFAKTMRAAIRPVMCRTAHLPYPSSLRSHSNDWNVKRCDQSIFKLCVFGFRQKKKIRCVAGDQWFQQRSADSGTYWSIEEFRANAKLKIRSMLVNESSIRMVAASRIQKILREQKQCWGEGCQENIPALNGRSSFTFVINYNSTSKSQAWRHRWDKRKKLQPFTSKQENIACSLDACKEGTKKLTRLFLHRGRYKKRPRMFLNYFFNTEDD